MRLSSAQLEVIEADLDKTIFLSGPAGCGKSTAGVERLRYLVDHNVPGRSIFLLFPQRTLGRIYQSAINDISFNGKSVPTVSTLGGLARRSIEVFWPAIAQQAGFHDPNKRPTFLTLESTLYFLSQLMTPIINEEGLFASVTIQRNRLFSQILDNLNKSAVHGFSHQEISDRLITSWIGDPSQSRIYQDAQRAASLFRDHCYHHALLDYSLQIELFTKHLLPFQPFIEQFLHTYHHLIYDNIEEDVPIAHDFVKQVLPKFQSALLIYDTDAGYRSFLGASPSLARDLSSSCDEEMYFEKNYSTSPELESLNSLLVWSLETTSRPPPTSSKNLLKKVSITYHSYYPQIVSWVAEEIKKLTEKDTPPDQIVVLAPFLSDSMRFLLKESLNKLNIKSVSHRPSRAVRDEPATHCLLTLSALAHPSWNISLTPHDIALALMQAIEELDLTRAYLLAKHAFTFTTNSIDWVNFEAMPAEFQERITFFSGLRFQKIIDWLSLYNKDAPLPLDHFLIKLFGEVLSQPGFGFHRDFSNGKVAEELISSVGLFRNSAGRVLNYSNAELGCEYYQMVKHGILANQYPKSWEIRPKDAVFLAPAYTFLLSNTPVDYQFWLDVGSRGWYERIYQPLTNPYVLHREWSPKRQWRDIEEIELSQNNLIKITTGLIRRCKKGLFFCLTETDERGFEQNGMLIKALNKSIETIT